MEISRVRLPVEAPSGEDPWPNLNNLNNLNEARPSAVHDWIPVEPHARPTCPTTSPRLGHPKRLCPNDCPNLTNLPNLFELL